MDQRLPNGLLAERELDRRRSVPRAGVHSVRADGRTHPIVVLGKTGFVVETGPRMRGYVDILDGECLLDRRLVVLAWQDGGLTGYEFKSASSASAEAADQARCVDGPVEP